jgi:hypothetical protein
MVYEYKKLGLDAVAVRAVLAKASIKLAALRALLFVFGVGKGFEKVNHTQTLSLGSYFTQPAIVRHRN